MLQNLTESADDLVRRARSIEPPKQQDADQKSDTSTEMRRAHKLQVQVHGLFNYARSESTACDLYIQGDGAVLQDRDGRACELQSSVSFEPHAPQKECPYQLGHVFNLNLHELKRRFPDKYRQLTLVAVIHLDDENSEVEQTFGWIAHPLFTDTGRRNLGTFTQNILQLPVATRFPLEPEKTIALPERTTLRLEVRDI